VRRNLAVYTENEDIISLGAYARGSRPEIDQAIEKIDAIRTFLQQGVEETTTIEDTVARVLQLAGVTGS
jgi:flagellum-specific ATP synthase